MPHRAHAAGITGGLMCRVHIDIELPGIEQRRMSLAGRAFTDVIAI